MGEILPNQTSEGRTSSGTEVVCIRPPVAGASTRLSRLADRLAIARDQRQHQAEEFTLYPAALAAASLPYQDPGTLEWVRRAGDFELYVRGHRKYGMPYGVYARLLTMWITDQIKKTESRVIEFKGSYYAFLQALRLNTGGKVRRKFGEQADRLLNAAISYERTGENRVRALNASIATEYEAWWNADESHPASNGTSCTAPGTTTSMSSGKERRLVVGEVFFEHVMRHSFPLDIRIVFALRRKPLGLDMYAWMTYRYYTIARPTPVSWASLYNQFGWGGDGIPDAADLRAFKYWCRKYLEQIRILWPEANFKSTPRHLILHPSQPSITPKHPRYQLLIS